MPSRQTDAGSWKAAGGFGAPRCRCGEPAIARLVYLWADTPGERRTPPLCGVHYSETLTVFEGIQNNAPEAVAGMRILTVAP